MTKKEYKTIAVCLGRAYARGFSQLDMETWHKAVFDVFQRLTISFELDNPRFSRSKFLLMMDKISKDNQ